MKQLTTIILLFLALSLKVASQNVDTLFRHEIEIQLDTLLNSTIENFDRERQHWINMSFLDLPSETEFEIERFYQVIRKGLKTHDHFHSKEIFLKSSAMSFLINSCLLLPGDSIDIKLKYKLYNPWVAKWSNWFTTTKGFNVKTILNYTHSDYCIEVLTFNNRTVIQADKITLIPYLNGKEFNPFLYNEGNKYFYKNSGDSLKVKISSGHSYWEHTFNNMPKYGGYISCGIAEKKTMQAEIRKYRIEMKKYGSFYLESNYMKPYLLLDIDKSKRQVEYLILFDNCSNDGSVRSSSGIMYE